MQELESYGEQDFQQNDSSLGESIGNFYRKVSRVKRSDNPQPSTSKQAWQSTDAVKKMLQLTQVAKFNEEQNSWQIDVPRDNNCLFWSVALAYLIPVKSELKAGLFGRRNDKFRARFENLFVEKELKESEKKEIKEKLKYTQELIKNYNPFSNSKVVNVYSDGVFQGLIQRFREKVTNHIRESGWGGRIEIEAISGILKDCKIQLSGVKDYGNGDNNIELFEESGVGEYNHYSFGLGKDIGDRYKEIIDTVNSKLLDAVKNNKLQKIEDYLKKGADINIGDSNGDTPLHYGARNGSVKMIKLLLNRGADVNAKNSNDKSPIDVAKTNEIVKILKEEKEKELKERLYFFVEEFVKEFEDRVVFYHKEIDQKETKKAGKVSDALASITKVFLIIPKLGRAISEAVSVPILYLGRKNHRNKARRINTITSDKVITTGTGGDRKISAKLELKEILVGVGIDTFKNFESQFMKVTAAADVEWRPAITKLTKDAVDRVIDYLNSWKQKNLDEGVDYNSLTTLITKGIILGKSKEGMGAIITKPVRELAQLEVPYMPRPGHTVEKDTGDEWKTEGLYERAGLFKDNQYYKKSIGSKDIRRIVGSVNQYEYRLPFQWELNEWDKVKQKYVISQPVQQEYEYLDLVKLVELKEELLKRFNLEEKQEKKIQTEGNISGLGITKYYYIPRTFNRQIVIKDECLNADISDLFVISGIKENELSQLVREKEKVPNFHGEDFDKNKPVRFIASNNEKEAEKKFKELCANDNYSGKNIHWLKKENN